MKAYYFILLLFFSFFLKGGYMQTGQNYRCAKVNPLISDTAKIRFDGIYNPYDTSITPRGDKRNLIYKTDNFIVLFNNGKTYRCSSVSLDSAVFQEKYYTFLDSASLGNYKIINDSIFACTPTAFYKWGMRRKFFNAHYSGYIKNKDTIVDWKMVHPYPDVNPKYNFNFIYHTTPRMLYFIKNDAIRCLDSLVGQ
jgi:hypothetical protein